MDSGGFKSQQCQQLLTGPPKNIVRRVRTKQIKAPTNMVGLRKQLSRKTGGGEENPAFHFFETTEICFGLPK